MDINKAISVLSDPTKDALIIDNAELVGWLRELLEAKQYLRELMTITSSFGLDDVHRCGQVDNSCKHCKYFSHELNHALCTDYEYFEWEHYVEASKLIGGEQI